MVSFFTTHRRSVNLQQLWQEGLRRLKDHLVTNKFIVGLFAADF